MPTSEKVSDSLITVDEHHESTVQIYRFELEGKEDDILFKVQDYLLFDETN